jgi:transposase-like protein
VGGIWQYLYRAVDSHGQTLDFLLSPRRDAISAECFLRKALRSEHTSTPRVINADKNPAYPKAVADLQAQGRLSTSTTLRQVKYLNNLIEQDHRFIKRLSKPGLGFKSWRTAWRTIRGYQYYLNVLYSSKNLLWVHCTFMALAQALGPNTVNLRLKGSVIYLQSASELFGYS